MADKCSLKDITVVIPTLNEAEAIGKVIDELVQVGVPKENIVVVDGGSSDGTVEVARSKGVKVVFQEGKGKTDAVKTGLKHVTTEYALVIDGDYTYPAKHVPELLEKACREGLDEVIGYRFKGRENIPLINRFGNWVLIKTFNLLFGTKLKDVLSGMYIIRKTALSDAFFETKGFSVEAELAAHIASTTGRIGEVPIEYRRRIGESKLSILDGVKIGLNMVFLAWRYNPVFFIFTMGALLLIPGLILGAWVAYHYFFTGIKYYVKGLVAIILTLAGFQSLLLAILSLYLKRWEQRLTRRLNELRLNIRKTEK